ncbi:MAG: hypothetical protein RSE12_16990 [Fuscovulum sp.]|nr:MAG: hypothetical protein RSE12_16990 [Fuscovulum sp.]
MPAIQTNYPAEMAAAYEGMIANTEPNNLISRQVEGAAIGFGKVVKQGTASNGVAAATAAADVVRGITVRDQSVDANSPNLVPVNESALILQRGVIWVTAGESVVAGDPVYMVVGTAQAGRFGKTPTNNLAIPRAIFDSAGGVGALVKVRIG